MLFYDNDLILYGKIIIKFSLLSSFFILILFHMEKNFQFFPYNKTTNKQYLICFFFKSESFLFELIMNIIKTKKNKNRKKKKNTRL